MVSKTFIYFCLLLAIVLLISSEVAADAAEATMNPNGVRDAKYGGGYQGDPGRGRYGGGYQGDPGRGGYGAQVVVDMAVVGVLVEEVVAEMEEGVATMVAADGVTVEESA
ncbi:hypothetical protein C1H46_006645 [Malus baccata]|uniref:Glycine-rich protein n=1 Tax=Malus baccata TaxID=106549 RepID=A0A540N9I5_MALBA|nr:hypothetical protein C1H46_006645 [Malus baccata]